MTVKLSAIAAAGALAGTDTVIGVQSGPTDVQILVSSLNTFITNNIGAGPAKITSPAAASIQLGAADAATAVAQTLRVQSVVAGTASTSGANFTIIGSLSTGAAGVSGDIIFQTGVKGGATIQATPTTGFTIKGESQIFQSVASGTSSLQNTSSTVVATISGNGGAYLNFLKTAANSGYVGINGSNNIVLLDSSGSLEILTVTTTQNGHAGNVVLGAAAVATNVNDGFVYIPTTAGQPTGTPTSYTGRVAIQYDTTNHQFWIYDSGWKQPKTPAAAAIITWQ